MTVDWGLNASSLISMVVAAMMGLVVRHTRQTRDELRNLNGRLVKMEEWRKTWPLQHDKQDDERWEENKARHGENVDRFKVIQEGIDRLRGEVTMAILHTTQVSGHRSERE